MNVSLAESLVRLFGLYLLVDGLIGLAQYLLLLSDRVSLGQILMSCIPLLAAAVLFAKSDRIARFIAAPARPGEPSNR